MATIAHTSELIGGGITYYEWLALTEADDGEPIEVPAAADKTVQADGDFTTSGDLAMEGSMDKSNWFELTDADGAAVSFTAAGLVLIRENVRWIRPNITAGTSVAINARLLCKRVI